MSILGGSPKLINFAPVASIAFAAIFYIFSGTFGDSNSGARFVLFVSLTFLFQIINTVLHDEEERPVTLLSSLYIVFGLVVPGMIQSAYGQFPFYRLAYNNEDVFHASILILTFSISLYLGTIYGNVRKTKVSPSPSYIMSKNYVAAPIVLSAISLLVAFALGIDKFIIRRSDYGILVNVNIEYMLASNFARFSSFAALIATIYALSSRNQMQRSSTFLLVNIGCFLLALSVFFVVNYPASLPRFYLLAYAVSIALVIFQVGRGVVKYAIAILYPVFILTIFPILNALTRGRPGSEFLRDGREYILFSGDLDGFQSIVNVVRWIKIEGVQYGMQIGSALFVFVPRSIWPQKAAPTGSMAAAANGYSFLNISSPLPAELYSDFGWLGVVVGGSVLGLLMSLADRKFQNASRSGDAATILTVSLAAGFSAIILRGPLLGVIAPCVLALLILQAIRLCQSSIRPKN